MRYPSLKLCLTSLPLLAAAMVPPRCAGTARVKVTDPRTGIQGEASIEWKKDVDTAKVNTVIPPGAPAQTITVHGIKFDLPANPTQQPMPFVAEATDPVIVQVPVDWILASATVTTPAGSGAMVITTGAIPAAATITPTGTAVFSRFYAPQSGAKLVMGDYPPGLAVDGITSGEATFRIPPGPAPLTLLKFVSAGKITLFTPTGPVTWYPPIDPYETDFARVADSAHLITVDTLHGTACPNAIGSSPSMLLSPVDWKIGTTARLACGSLMPGAATSFMLGVDELKAPLPFGPGGCKLRVDPSVAVVLPTVAGPGGVAGMPIAIPPVLSLIDAVFAVQAAEFDPPATLAFSNHMKLRIED
jgi:hypothetical protein